MGTCALGLRQLLRVLRRARRLILAAALAINVVLKPTGSYEHKPRQRHRVFIWFNKPSSWIARLRMFPHKPPETPSLRRARREQPRVLRSFPLARRLEAVRRVLADPDTHAHRLAVKLARIAARNAKANQPRLFGVRGTPTAFSTAASASSAPAWSLSCR